ncbi:uncharacterized protein ACOB8E_010046 [Sarcophilus harrisii]
MQSWEKGKGRGAQPASSPCLSSGSPVVTLHVWADRGLGGSPQGGEGDTTRGNGFGTPGEEEAATPSQSYVGAWAGSARGRLQAWSVPKKRQRRRGRRPREARKRREGGGSGEREEGGRGRGRGEGGRSKGEILLRNQIARSRNPGAGREQWERLPWRHVGRGRRPSSFPPFPAPPTGIPRARATARDGRSFLGGGPWGRREEAAGSAGKLRGGLAGPRTAAGPPPALKLGGGEARGVSARWGSTRGEGTRLVSYLPFCATLFPSYGLSCAFPFPQPPSLQPLANARDQCQTPTERFPPFLTTTSHPERPSPPGSVSQAYPGLSMALLPLRNVPK